MPSAMRAAISGRRIGWTPGREAVTENCSKAGEVDLKVPRLRSLSFETEIIQRYQTKQSSVEEALIEMYLSGVSVRRVEDITEVLWGERSVPAPSATSIRRSTARSKSGGCVRSTRSIPTCSWMVYI